MTLDDFRIILSHINPTKTQLHFSGFSEAFLTEEAEDMMIESYRRGFSVVLYTTLEGLTDEKIEKLSKSGIVFSHVDFHEYKGNGFNLEKFESVKKKFVDSIKSKSFNTTMITDPVSRSGNNWDVAKKLGPIKCMTNRYFSNVVLPNGDLYLCCNDWSLKHWIGNIYEGHYDSFMKNRLDVISKCVINDGDVICRKCEQAYNY